MRRLDDWDVRLSRYLINISDKPHLYGSVDCALFAAGAVLAMTGEDPAAHLRGTYETELGAAKAMRRNGWETLSDVADHFLPEIEIREAKRGDILLCPGEAGEFLAVKMGAYAVSAGPRGIANIVLRKTPPLSAWRVA